MPWLNHIYLSREGIADGGGGSTLAVIDFLCLIIFCDGRAVLCNIKNHSGTAEC